MTKGKIDLNKDDQKAAMRHWVFEANIATRNIALIRAFDEQIKLYRKSNPDGKNLINPSFDPVGRVCIQFLDIAVDALILFCHKALEGGKDNINLERLKNAIVCDTCVSDTLKNTINDGFKRFDRSQNKIKRLIETLRNKRVAHTDFAYLLQQSENTLILKNLLDYAEQIICLVKSLAKAFKNSGTFENPTTCDTSFVLTSKKGAQIDAEAFWCRCLDF